ncbi:nuclear transport factor 2 family protein [Fretibacter rubidus]|uniref:nuclear transport factor 2 family protein n=1 Tax=Fretibacter rubidus TaxID=570162 RepID=UPI00352B1321
MQAEDYFEIQNQLNRYFQYVDTGDFERCGELFTHADLIYLQSGQTYSKDPAGITRQMRSFVKLYGEANIPQTRHHSGNMIIESDGENCAKTSCSAIIFQSTEVLPFQAIAEASYNDRFEKRAQGWIFIERKMTLNFMGDMAHHLLREVST